MFASCLYYLHSFLPPSKLFPVLPFDLFPSSFPSSALYCIVSEDTQDKDAYILFLFWRGAFEKRVKSIIHRHTVDKHQQLFVTRGKQRGINTVLLAPSPPRSLSLSFRPHANTLFNLHHILVLKAFVFFLWVVIGCNLSRFSHLSLGVLNVPLKPATALAYMTCSTIDLSQLKYNALFLRVNSYKVSYSYFIWWIFPKLVCSKTKGVGLKPAVYSLIIGRENTKRFAALTH